jgi:hypothetical protein
MAKVLFRAVELKHESSLASPRTGKLDFRFLYFQMRWYYECITPCQRKRMGSNFI